MLSSLRLGAILTIGPVPPQKKGPFLGGKLQTEIFFSTRRMYIIRCALELCDPGAPFEYLKHVRDVKTFPSRLV